MLQLLKCEETSNILDKYINNKAKLFYGYFGQNVKRNVAQWPLIVRHPFPVLQNESVA